MTEQARLPQRTWKRARTVAEGWVPTRHGVATSYNRGCRCTECRAANAERMRTSGARQRFEAKEKAARVLVDGRLTHPDPVGGSHGTLSAYTGSHCRCLACCEAARLHRRSKQADAT